MPAYSRHLHKHILVYHIRLVDPCCPDNLQVSKNDNSVYKVDLQVVIKSEWQRNHKSFLLCIRVLLTVYLVNLVFCSTLNEIYIYTISILSILCRHELYMNEIDCYETCGDRNIFDWLFYYVTPPPPSRYIMNISPHW